MDRPLMRKQSIFLGILCVILAALAFATMSVFVKEVGNRLPTSMLIFFRFVFSLLLLMPWLWLGPPFSFKISEPWRYAVRILSSLFALFLLFYVIKFIPLVDALLLNNTSPLFVPIIAWLTLRAKTPHRALIGILIGFVGVALILHPNTGIFQISSALALLSGLLVAVSMVQMRMLSKKSTFGQMLFYYFFVSTLITGIWVAVQWETPANAHLWFLLVGIGVMGALYQVCVTLSTMLAPVRLMSPFLFLTVVFGSLFDWMIWGRVPENLTIIGFVLILVGAMMIVYFGKKGINTTSSREV